METVPALGVSVPSVNSLYLEIYSSCEADLT